MFSLGHVAQHFAAYASGAGLAIGHDTTGRGDDGHTQTVHDGGDSLAATIDTQAGTRHAIDAFDDGTSSVVIQRDFQNRLGLVARQLEVFNVVCVLKYGCDDCLELGGEHAYRLVDDHLPVADTCQHIGDRIAHAHLCVPPTSWPWSCPALRHAWSFRAICGGLPRTCCIHPGRDR